MPSLIGNNPSQVPTNGDLGTLAFQDSGAVNITGGIINVSNIIATSNVSANAIFDSGVELLTYFQGVDNTQNTRINSIETINTNQNTSITIIQGVNLTQNTRLNAIETINTNQNTTISIIQGVDLGQNATITAVNQFAQAAFNRANTEPDSFNFLANTILVANATGYISNSSMAFSASNNNVFLPSNVAIGISTPTSNPGRTTLSLNGAADGGIYELLKNGTRTFLLYNPTGTNDTQIQASSSSGLRFATNNAECMRIDASGNVSIGTTSTTYKLQVNGSFAATTKSFVIPHPTKEGKQLRYGSLEGPENGVYIRGKLKDSDTIELPDYWTKLVDPDSITVQVTPIGQHQKLYVKEISNNKVIIGNENVFAKSINCFYVIWAERNDVEKLQVEVD
jgi:hypothetical protein